MKLFKLYLRRQVGQSLRDASVFEGPFVVAAEDEESARDLIAFNCDQVADVVPGHTVPNRLWRDDHGSACDLIEEIEAPEVRQSHFVNGMDVAPWYLDALELSDGQEAVAQMVWWPVKPNERCPI